MMWDHSTAIVLEVSEITNNGFSKPYSVTRVLTSHGEAGWLGSKYLIRLDEVKSEV